MGYSSLCDKRYSVRGQENTPKHIWKHPFDLFDGKSDFRLFWQIWSICCIMLMWIPSSTKFFIGLIHNRKGWSCWQLLLNESSNLTVHSWVFPITDDGCLLYTQHDVYKSRCISCPSDATFISNLRISYSLAYRTNYFHDCGNRCPNYSLQDLKMWWDGGLCVWALLKNPNDFRYLNDCSILLL